MSSLTFIMEPSLRAHQTKKGPLETRLRLARAIATLSEAPRRWTKASLCKTSSGSVRLHHTWEDSRLPMHRDMLRLIDILLLVNLQEKSWRHQEELVLPHVTIKRSLHTTLKSTERSQEKCMSTRPSTLLIQARSAHQERSSRDK